MPADPYIQPSRRDGAVAGASAEVKSCPLCAGVLDAASWLGRVCHEGRVFSYLKCRGCRSGVCDPMPDDALLSRMYGPGYASCGGPDGHDDPKDPSKVIDWLRLTPMGRFVDYGCGRGELLMAAGLLGWKVAGVEFEPSVARTVSERLGLPVFAAGEGGVAHLGPVDTVHLGDVIEHLVQPEQTVRELLSIVRPGGLVLAQGPLEAGPCLFATALQWWQRAVRPPPRLMAPYHVVMATAVGQRQFFARMGLEEIEYRVSEVHWPAPTHVRFRDLARPRSLALWALRQLSMIWSGARPHSRGNRYFFAGRRAE